MLAPAIGKQRVPHMKNLAPETVAAQAGGVIDEETGAIVRPVHMATTFLRDPDNQYRKGYSYGRADNATVRQVEAVLDPARRAAPQAWCRPPA